MKRLLVFMIALLPATTVTATALPDAAENPLANAAVQKNRTVSTPGLLAAKGATNTYTKIDAVGRALPDDAGAWNCVRDNSTGLIWEVKTADGGLHGKEHTYTWYNPDEAMNGGVEGREGEPDDMTCGNPAVVREGCDTQKYVAAVNAAGWCGQRDWRLPTVDELRTLVDYGSNLPAISTSYFPDIVMPAGFWTATPSAAGPSYAWIVIFDDGYLGTCVKSWNYYLRLVRDNK